MSAALSEETIRALPKVELHCHLDGSVPLAAYREMARLHPGLLPADEAELLRQVQAPQRSENLAGYLSCFDVPLRVLQDMECLRIAAHAQVKELAAENVIYAELRFAPLPLAGGGADARHVVQTVVDALREAETAFGVTTRAILCMMRGAADEENRKVLELAKGFMGKGVAGVDIAGDEAGYPLALYGDLFRRAAAYGLPFTIHAGEQGSAANVRDALSFGARRIGHGIATAQDEALVRQLAETGALLEMCPVSNWQTHAVEAWPDYPFARFLQAGVHVCVNTDNRTVSATSLTREFALLAQHYSFMDAACIQKLSLAALEGAFLGEAEKAPLREKILCV